MKVNKLYLLFTLLVPAFAIAQEKKPVQVKEVWGNMPREYAIVYTTIVNNPKDEKAEGKPIITRREIGRVKAAENVAEGKLTSIVVDKVLSIPQKPIEYKSDIPDYASKIAGAIGGATPDPRGKAAAVAVNAIALLAKEGMRIAGQKMTEFYGNDPTTINMLEIVPTHYYRINTDTGEIQITDNFMPDLEKWNNLLGEYLPVAKEWNSVIVPYNKAYAQWQKSDPTQTDEAQINSLSTMYKNTVEPVLKKRLALETQLATYALHRMAIIPDFNKPGTTCSAIGYKGPWSLNVYMYIGAKQTNIFNIDFCVKNTDADQNIIVELIPNTIDPKTTAFRPGGVRFSSTLDKTATFPVQTGTQRVNWDSTRSRLLNWFDELMVKDKATNINDYLISFDVMKIRDELAKEAEKTQKKEKKKNLELFDAAIKAAEEGTDKVLEQKEKQLELREKELEVKEKEKEAKEAGKDEEEDKEEDKGLLERGKELIKEKGKEFVKELLEPEKEKKEELPFLEELKKKQEEKKLKEKAEA